MNPNPYIKTNFPGPNTKKWLEGSAEWVCGRSQDLVVSEEKGVYVTDVDGNIYLDFTGAGQTNNIGYSHPRVIDAIKEQADKGITPLSSLRLRIELAQRIIKISPGELARGKVAFCTTGSDATEFAIKMVRSVYPGRTGLFALQGAYHGSYLGGLSVTMDNSQLRRYCLGALQPSAYAPFAYCYRCSFGQEFPGCGYPCVEYIKYVLDTVAPPEEMAAFFVEPIQAHAGNIVPPEGFLSKVKRICEQNKILLVDDEVVTGFGRTGKMWGIENWIIEPDIMLLGKPIAAGLPLAAIVGKREIMDRWVPELHLRTAFAGNPVSCSAALASINVIEQEQLLENSAKVGNYMMKRLKEMAEEYEFIGDVRGKGLLIGVELVKDRRTKEPAPDLVRMTIEKARDKSLLLYAGGTYRQTIRFSPPLSLTTDEAEKGLNILEEAFREVGV